MRKDTASIISLLANHCFLESYRFVPLDAKIKIQNCTECSYTFSRDQNGHMTWLKQNIQIVVTVDLSIPGMHSQLARECPSWFSVYMFLLCLTVCPLIDGIKTVVCKSLPTTLDVCIIRLCVWHNTMSCPKWSPVDNRIHKRWRWLRDLTHIAWCTLVCNYRPQSLWTAEHSQTLCALYLI